MLLVCLFVVGHESLMGQSLLGAKDGSGLGSHGMAQDCLLFGNFESLLQTLFRAKHIAFRFWCHDLGLGQPLSMGC